MKTLTKTVTAGTAVLAALGAVMLSGRKGAERRERVSSWMLRLKADVLDEVEEMKDVTEAKYDQLVDRLTSRYERTYKVGAQEMDRVRKDLKHAWSAVRDELRS